MACGMTIKNFLPSKASLVAATMYKDINSEKHKVKEAQNSKVHTTIICMLLAREE